MIIILSHSGDPHAKSVAKALEIKKEEYFFYDTSKVKNYKLTLNSSNNKNLDFKLNNYLLSDLVIYNRRPIEFWHNKHLFEPSSVNRYLLTEFSQLFINIFLVNDSYWINHPTSNSNAGRKLSQLIYANNKGVKVPDWILTNEYKEYKKFKKNQSIIFKTLGTHDIYEEKIVYTSSIENDLLFTKADLKLCPSFFQVKIKKKYDIRIIVIGGKAFGFKASTENLSNIDWRFHHQELAWQIWEIPSQICNFVIDMNISFKLKYGAYDFIESTDGEVYFLELNPNGQWLWLQIDTGIDLASEISDLLINTKNNVIKR